MAFDEVTEDAVYTCVGHPLRKDIHNIVHWMLNEDFTSAFNRKIFFLKHTCVEFAKSVSVSSCVY